jgi:hypothetical protein
LFFDFSYNFLPTHALNLMETRLVVVPANRFQTRLLSFSFFTGLPSTIMFVLAAITQKKATREADPDCAHTHRHRM